MRERSMSVALFSALIALSVEAQAQKEPLSIAFPNGAWALQIAAPGFAVTQNVTQPDGRRYLLATNDSSGSVLSITLEKVTGAATPEGCREAWHGRTTADNPVKLTEISESQIGDMALLEYMIPVANGVPVKQKNLFGCLARDTVYADVHLSKVGFKESDEPALKAILNSARFADVAQDSLTLFGEGSAYFLRQEYGKAIGPYQKALDQEKTTPKLDVPKWRILIDNLAMAYGINGKLDTADEILKYGISKDPNYPMFYFLMADSSAERNDFDNTMKFLRLALKFRSNTNAGEKLPDPLTDDSFKPFYQNPEFRKLAADFR
jgi:tetratricopeptide (TPR) repeat protein